MLHQKPTRRQSFSIESLAVSSHQEPVRDTDSPYLYYLETRSSAVAVDHNSNKVSQSQTWNYSAHEKERESNNTRLGIHDITVPSLSANKQTTELICNSRLPSHSTPKVSTPQRRSLDSTSTPSSSDDSGADDRMVIDDSSVLTECYPDVEKQSPASTTASSTASDIDNESTCSDDIPRARGHKKARTAFSGGQLKELEKRYKSQKYLTASDRTNIARALKLKEQQVKTWFQNRRMKEKRQQREEEQSRGFCLPTGGVDIAQLAALGICPPPYHLSSTPCPTNPLPANQQYSRLPSPVHSPQQPTIQNGNVAMPPISSSPYTLALDNMPIQNMHTHRDFQNMLRNETYSGKFNAFVGSAGIHAPLAVYTGRRSLPNMGLSPNSPDFRYINNAR